MHKGTVVRIKDIGHNAILDEHSHKCCKYTLVWDLDDKCERMVLTKEIEKADRSVLYSY